MIEFFALLLSRLRKRPSHKRWQAIQGILELRAKCNSAPGLLAPKGITG